MEFANLFQRRSPVGADHRAGIHNPIGYRLHTAVAIREKVQIRTGLSPRFLEMRFEADPLGTRWDCPVSGEL
jgi:hypothetical protein